jgi:hypothetical protein
MVSTLHPLSTPDLDTFLYQTNDKPLGDSYTLWTERWWNWFVSLPHHQHPAKDPSGTFAYTGQTNPKVLFLTGAVNRKAARTVKNVPRDKPILIGLLVVENSLLEWPGSNLNDLQKLSQGFSDDMISLKLIIDEGKENEIVCWTGYLCKYRVQSKAFDLDFAKDNLFAHKGGNTQAAADGYWAFLKENIFKSGSEHSIEFISEGEYYSTAVKYYLNIK